jgi:hypothetical protein
MTCQEAELLLGEAECRAAAANASAVAHQDDIMQVCAGTSLRSGSRQRSMHEQPCMQGSGIPACFSDGVLLFTNHAGGQHTQLLMCGSGSQWSNSAYAATAGPMALALQGPWLHYSICTSPQHRLICHVYDS